MNSPGREVDEEQDKEADKAVRCDHFDREEVRGHDALSVGGDELRPGELGSTTTSRGQPVPSKHVGDALVTHSVAEV